ncbi:MAG TPA: glutaminyl-peptide cyclotransferase [Actinomycetota bacterium]|nr:glutaminyl-peptide cyclotransferase [Actinomycetota bacterium]
MWRRLLPIGLSAFLFATTTVGAGAQVDPGFTVVNTYHHDPTAFTEGLAFNRAGTLYEGTGVKGTSSIRRVELTTGQVLRRHSLGDRYFGEGVTIIGHRAFQLTWKQHRAWTYRSRNFETLRRFHYRTEGWGLTDHLGRLFMSDGTSTIRVRDPKTFEVVRRIAVTDGGNEVTGLNELEWVDGEIFANVWPTDDVVRIDPDNGNVVGRFSLASLAQQERDTCDNVQDVTNGIAYMPDQDRLFVTGKYWCHLYEIELANP